MIFRTHIKQNERGRSMVEILGVLSVIAVLLFGGIQGYRYAFNKYQANETVYELNLRANDISQRMERLIELNHVGKIDMEMGNVMRTGYPIRARMHPQFIDFFEIFVTDVPSDVCKLILQSNWNAAFSTFVNVTQYEQEVAICEQGETVELAYEFHKDLIQFDDIDEEERHEIQRCNHDNNCGCGSCSSETGLCESYCTNSEQCVKDYDDARWMVCCQKEYIIDGYCCASITEDGKCCNREGKCCAENQFLNKNGSCVTCNSAGNYYTEGSKAECSKCENRVHGFNLNDKCMLKCDTVGTYTEDKPLANIDGVCHACDYSGSINLGTWGDNSRCVQLCPNRTLLNGQYCVINVCSGETPLVNTSGQCRACDLKSILPKQDNCETACPGIRQNTSNGCELIGCPDGYFKQKDGTCVSCGDSGNYYTFSTKAECDKCENRVHGFNYNDKCMLKCDTVGTYTEDKPLANIDGVCHACDYSGSINLGTWGDNTRCSKLCPNRALSGSSCVRKSCPTERLLMGTDGACYQCNIALSIQTTAENCALCINRTYKDGYCILQN